MTYSLILMSSLISYQQGEKKYFQKYIPAICEKGHIDV